MIRLAIVQGAGSSSSSPASEPPRLPPRTPLQRFALATVTKDHAHELARVPNPIPKTCAFNNFRCVNHVRFKVDEGYLCRGHVELFWESHEVFNHRVVRL
jgi:hypothetical protein